MNSIDIYIVLQSRPNNPHYLKRYYNFILACIRANRDFLSEQYTELHHICPKAMDMFNEYADLYEHQWNGVELTARQHILAHILLWKAFDNQSQLTAVHYMLNVQNSNTIGFSKRKVPTSIAIRYSAKAREEFYARKLGCSTYKDSEGNQYYLHESDPKIQELNLVGFRSGVTFTAEHKQSLSDSKLYNRKIPMTFLDLTRMIPLFSEEYDEHIAQGWQPKVKYENDGVFCLDEDDRKFRHQLRYENRSKTTQGTYMYCYLDGTMFGQRLLPYDIRIEQLNLSKYVSDNTRIQAKENAKKATQANLGSSWYNNGIVNKKFKSDPGGEWQIGQLPYKEGALDFRKQRASEANLGSTTYNDGARNYRVLPGDYIDPVWSLGMAPQKPRKKSSCVGVELWNDGIKNYRISPGEYTDPAWTRGMVKGTKKRMKYTNGIDIIMIVSGDIIPFGYKKATKSQINALPLNTQ